MRIIIALLVLLAVGVALKGSHDAFAARRNCLAACGGSTNVLDFNAATCRLKCNNEHPEPLLDALWTHL